MAALVWVRVELGDDGVEVEEDERLAGGRVDPVDHAGPVDRAVGRVAAGAPRDRVDVVAELAAGPGRIRTMSPPKEEVGVSSETEVIAAASGKAVSGLTAPVWTGRWW